MRKRCSNPNGSHAKWYFEKGIKVCERWDSFENFITDMGRRPGPDYDIDRIDPDGDYEPGNCRWLTHSENSRRAAIQMQARKRNGR